MKSVKIAELKDHLSEHLRAVERGADVIVTDRDRPIARITPYSGVAKSVRMNPPTREFGTVRDRVRTPAGWPVTSTALLLEERGDR